MNGGKQLILIYANTQKRTKERKFVNISQYFSEDPIESAPRND